MTYHHVGKFNGSMYLPPSIEIPTDFEVPDTNLIGSPGGLSSTAHHYTKGFYGIGGSSSDIYGGQGVRDIYGEYGNLYTSGFPAGDHMGIYATFPSDRYYPQSSVPPNYYGQQNGMPPERNNATNNPSIDHFEIVPMPDPSETKTSTKDIKSKDIPTTPLVIGQVDNTLDVNNSAILLIIISFLLYLMCLFGGRATYTFLGAKYATWKDLAIYSLIALIILILVIRFFWKTPKID